MTDTEGRRPVNGSYTTVRRMSIIGACASAFVLIDGLALFATGGLSSDATPVFPVLGGSFNATRSSGTSLIVLGVIMAAVTFFGWWTLGRRLRAAERAGVPGAGGRPEAGQHTPPRRANVSRHDG